jgi:A/G-specific adenine glycosylase
VLPEGMLGVVKRQLTHRSLSLRLLRVSGVEKPQRPVGFLELRWCSESEALALGMSTAMHKALEVALGAQ